tara:strand:- start:52 stop:891 length:840 start_codon:yes stop_codon:yes gene_type:complete
MIIRNTLPNTKNIVITGSTKGIGKEIAKKLLAQGHNVVITSSNPKNVYSTYREFKKDITIDGKCFPVVADISSFDDCTYLLSKSLNLFDNHIDIWINNAGVSFKNNLIDLNEHEILTIVNTNIIGTIFCCRVVIPHMLQQKNGILINFEGAGSNGFPTPDFSVYGSTKCAITQFTRSISKEYSKSNINFCTISPGMVITELLLHNADVNSKQIFNIFCESTDHIANYLVNKINNIKHNEHIRYLTINRIFLLFLLSFFRKNRFFDKYGNMVKSHSNKIL